MSNYIRGLIFIVALSLVYPAYAWTSSTPEAKWNNGGFTIADPLPHRCVDRQALTDDITSGNYGYDSAVSELTGNVYQFLRGIYALSLDTPPGLPPGDKAIWIHVKDHDTIMFIDESKACDPIDAPKELLDLLHSVSTGVVTHVGNKS